MKLGCSDENLTVETPAEINGWAGSDAKQVYFLYGFIFTTRKSSHQYPVRMRILVNQKLTLQKKLEWLNLYRNQVKWYGIKSLWVAMKQNNQEQKFV